MTTGLDGFLKAMNKCTLDTTNCICSKAGIKSFISRLCSTFSSPTHLSNRAYNGLTFSGLAMVGCVSVIVFLLFRAICCVIMLSESALCSAIMFSHHMCA
jgi:hypothetical protein